MTERPILFSGPMVQPILADTKLMTRRVCKPAQFYSLSAVVELPDPQERGQVYNGTHFGDEEGDVQFASPYGGRGDRLWVREAWARTRIAQDATDAELTVYREGDNRTDYGGPWKPGIHMFRRDSRITLEVTGVRVERLQDISEADARAEGVIIRHPGQAAEHFANPATPEIGVPTARDAYRQLWESINGSGSWAANPWVWCVSFKRLERT